MARIHKAPGKSHDPNQAVQHAVQVRNKAGNLEPDGTCRIEVICTTDGEPRVWIDDGHSSTSNRSPGQARQQIQRNMELRDEDGDPLFFVREPLTSFPGHKVDGDRVVIQPVSIPVLDDRIREKIARNRANRDVFLAGAKGTAGMVEVKGPIVDTGGAIEVKAPAAVVEPPSDTAPKKAPKEKA